MNVGFSMSPSGQMLAWPQGFAWDARGASKEFAPVCNCAEQ